MRALVCWSEKGEMKNRPIVSLVALAAYYTRIHVRVYTYVYRNREFRGAHAAVCVHSAVPTSRRRGKHFGMARFRAGSWHSAREWIDISDVVGDYVE